MMLNDDGEDDDYDDVGDDIGEDAGGDDDDAGGSNPLKNAPRYFR